MKEAMLWEKLPDGRVRCNLCSHRCTIADGKTGRCRVRENRGGSLFTRNYGRPVAERVDPVEKKPLFHFHPGENTYSFAAAGCNFRCRWCQNWRLSQTLDEERMIHGVTLPAEQIVASAQHSGCQMIAYTYTEPTVFFEYAHDTARLAHTAGLENVLVTNGYMTGETLATARSYFDAAAVDLKAFRDKTYRQYVGARLQPVLDSLMEIKRLGLWLEVTTLIVPGVNDDSGELRDAAFFVAGELGADTPWHVSRFYPAYKMTGALPTPARTLWRAREIGLRAGLKYVYVGNMSDPGCEDTICPKCSRPVIRRDRSRLLENRIRDGRCPDCGAYIAGIGMG